MRIAVDASPWFNERGYGRYTRELLRAAVRLSPQHEYVFLLDARDTGRLGFEAPNLSVRGVELEARPTDAASSAGNRSLRDLLAMRRAAKEIRPHVVFYPTVYTFFPAPGGTARVVTIHDAIAERFPQLTLPTRRARLFWKLKVKLALAQADVVLTVSEYAADEIAEVLRVPRRRIHVTGEAPAKDFKPGASSGEIEAAAARAGLPPGSRWITYVGGFNPHKNVRVLVGAHARLARELGEAAPHLVLVGTRDKDVFHQEIAAIEAAVEAGGAARLVRWTGFLPDEELRFLHCGAICAVLPSASEGFGLPMIEAAACGAPVVATARSPLPRLLTEGGLFIEPGDETALFGALATMCRDARARSLMAAEALRRASTFTWDRAALFAIGALEAAVR